MRKFLIRTGYASAKPSRRDTHNFERIEQIVKRYDYKVEWFNDKGICLSMSEADLVEFKKDMIEVGLFSILDLTRME